MNTLLLCITNDQPDAALVVQAVDPAAQAQLLNVGHLDAALADHPLEQKSSALGPHQASYLEQVAADTQSQADTNIKTIHRTFITTSTILVYNTFNQVQYTVSKRLNKTLKAAAMFNICRFIPINLNSSLKP